MSRASPFPTRRTRSPSQSSTNVSLQTSFPSSSSRFPQPNRSPSPQTAYGNPVAPPTLAPSPLGGPSRPQRSELRSRLASEHSISERSSNRDSMSTTYSDVTQAYRPRNGASGIPASSSDTRSRSQRTNNDQGESDTSPITPTLSAVVSAFQNAGARKRAMTNGSEDMEQERKREKEMQAERLRQQRIQDRMPGRRTNRKAKAGDIDGG
jgi:exocyst complex component 4